MIRGASIAAFAIKSSNVVQVNGTQIPLLIVELIIGIYHVYHFGSQDFVDSTSIFISSQQT